MTTAVAFGEPRWYRAAVQLAALSAFVCLVYFVALWRGWIAGDLVGRERMRPSMVLTMASATSMLISHAIRPRSIRWALVLMLGGAALFAWAIPYIGRGN